VRRDAKVERRASVTIRTDRFCFEAILQIASDAASRNRCFPAVKTRPQVGEHRQHRQNFGTISERSRVVAVVAVEAKVGGKSESAVDVAVAVEAHVGDDPESVVVEEDRLDAAASA